MEPGGLLDRYRSCSYKRDLTINVKHKSYVRFVRSRLNYHCLLHDNIPESPVAGTLLYYSTPSSGLAPCFDLCIAQHKNDNIIAACFSIAPAVTYTTENANRIKLGISITTVQEQM